MKPMIYPFNRESLPLSVYLSRINTDFESPILAAPRGVIPPVDAGFIDNRGLTGLTVSNNAETELENVDCLIATCGDSNHVIHKNTSRIIQKALLSHKNVFCATTFSDVEYKKMEEIAEKSGVELIDLNHLKVEKNYESEKLPLSLYEPSIPIIGIGGICESTNEFELAVQLTLFLQEKGFKVSTIGESQYSKLLKIYPIPSYIKNGISSESVKYFNLYVKNIINEDQPDVVIVHFPGLMMKYNRILTGDFGLSAYLISQAIQPDYFICCTPYQMYGDEFAENVSTTFTNRFGFPVNCFHMSNSFVDSIDSNEKGNFFISYVAVDRVKHFLNQESGNKVISVYTALDFEMREVMFTQLLSDLT